MASLAAVPAAAKSDPTVAGLRFEGLSFASQRELRDAIVTSAPSWKPWRADPPFDEETLREDLDRIVDFYRERGYFEAQAEYELEWNSDRSAVRISIQVSEAEPVVLADWIIDLPEGNWLDDQARAQLLEGLPLNKGSVFGAVHYKKAKEALLERVADIGHPTARVKGGVDVDLETHTAQLHWSLEPGPEVRLGPTRFVGLQEVEEGLVRRELTFAEGEVFSLKALDATQKAIYGLELFRSVTLQDERPALGEAKPSDSDTRITWPILARVEERPPRTIRIGAGYGTEDQFRGKLVWTHRNFHGGARKLDITAKYSSLLAGVEGQLTQPHFLVPNLRLDADLSLLRETVPAYDAYRVSAGLLLSRPLIERWKGRLGPRLEWSDVTDRDADDSIGDDSASTFALKLGASRSTVEDPLDPQSGTWLDLSLAPTLIGSGESFVKLLAEGRVYVPLLSTVLAARVLGGTIQPLPRSGRDDIPTVSRFYAGGSGSVRGFAFQRQPPLDDDEDPLGGLSLVEGSVELRFPIWRFVRGVAFFDAGQLSAGPFAFEWGNVYYSVGPGIRIQTPVGSLGLDYGYLLRRVSGLDRGRIHFSVGTTF